MKTSARIIMSLAKNEFRIGASARFHFMWLLEHKKIHRTLSKIRWINGGDVGTRTLDLCDVNTAL